MEITARSSVESPKRLTSAGVRTALHSARFESRTVERRRSALRDVVADSGHVPPSDLLAEEMRAWLDRYLGVPRRLGPSTPWQP
jgi:hypothetical protein